MITQAEIVKLSSAEGITTDNVDKNWVLGHILAEFFIQKRAQDMLVFKGGTCIKKCYIPDYRFSEDLDFSLRVKDFPVTDKLIKQVCSNVQDKTGILLHPKKIELIKYRDRPVGFKTIIRFWGANHPKNKVPPAPEQWHSSVKIEITSNEIILDEINFRPVFHDFSDKEIVNGITIPCYSIHEMLAEKLRSLLQRNYQAPRDYYDIWNLNRISGSINWELVSTLFKEKAKFKNIVFEDVEDFYKGIKVDNFSVHWKNSLGHHLPDGKLPEFSMVFGELKELFDSLPL